MNTEYDRQQVKDFWTYIKYMDLMASSIETPVVDGPEDISYDAFIQSDRFQKFIDRNGTRYMDQFTIKQEFANEAVDFFNKYKRGEITADGNPKEW